MLALLRFSPSVYWNCPVDGLMKAIREKKKKNISVKAVSAGQNDNVGYENAVTVEREKLS